MVLLLKCSTWGEIAQAEACVTGSGSHKTSPGAGMRRTRDIEVREKTGEQLATSLLIYLLQLHRTE